VLGRILIMALLPGLIAMLIYYEGLKKTPASVATFVELVFPVAAIAVSTAFLGSQLSATQLVSAAVLMAAVTQISRLKSF
jgi:drug/metabolite transporter, DME family